MIYGAGLVGVVVAWQLVQWHEVVGGLLLVAAVVTVVGIVGFAVLRLEPIERDRTLVVLFLTMVSMVFWAFFEQAGSSMNLFTERNVDKHLFGFTIQASQFQAFNPAFIILLAPVFSWLWVALARRRFEPSTPAKFGLGVMQVGLGFAALVYGAQQADGGGIVAAGWLALAYLLHTTGRAVFVAGRTIDGHEAVGAARRRFDDGCVVSIERVLALRRGPDRGRGERIGDAGRRGRRWRRFAGDLR